MATTPFHGGKPRVVRGVGPASAKIILLGEAPGRDEVWEGRPFVGMAGKLQEAEAWRPLGIQRSDVRIENVCEERPPNNDIEAMTPRAVVWWQLQCHKRLDKILESGAGRVIVPTGNLALNTLLREPLPIFGDRSGKKAGGWRLRPGQGIIWPKRIGQYRGSLLTYTTNSGIQTRMIPTTHPASFLYGNLGYEAWKGDWRRIAREVAGGCPPIEEGEDRIATSARECAQFERELGDYDVLSVDLETMGELLLCAGLAVRPHWSFTIPLVDPDTMQAVPWGWFWLAKILAHDIPKVTWNGLFDTFLLRWHKLPVHRWRWDGMAMHHLLDPSDQHSLGYCASRDLRTVFWKAESKEEEQGARGGIKKARADWGQFLRYCGKDARHAVALSDIYHTRLEAKGLLDVYRKHYKRVMWASLDLSLTGFTVDEAERARLHAEATSELERLRHAMAEVAGYPLTTGPRILKSGKPSKAKSQPKGGLSNPAILKYFY